MMNQHVLSDRKRILLVEDDKAIATVLQHFLSENQLDVLCAKDATSAKALFNCHRFDSLLIDVQLPDGSGFELYDALKASDQAQDLDIPIMYMSGVKVDMDSISSGYSHGACDYILKPFDPAILLKKLQALLQMSTRIKELEYVVEEKVALEEELLHLDTDYF